MTLAWATHRLNGIATPANAAYTAAEVEFQMKSSGAKALFTVRVTDQQNQSQQELNLIDQCIPLLETALQASKAAGIPNNRIYILEMPRENTGDKTVPFKTVGQLIGEGEKLPAIESLKWEKGQGAKQTAYLCYSSGTSGLPVSPAQRFDIGAWRYGE